MLVEHKHMLLQRLAIKEGALYDDRSRSKNGKDGKDGGNGGGKRGGVATYEPEYSGDCPDPRTPPVQGIIVAPWTGKWFYLLLVYIITVNMICVVFKSTLTRNHRRHRRLRRPYDGHMMDIWWTYGGQGSLLPDVTGRGKGLGHQESIGIEGCMWGSRTV